MATGASQTTAKQTIKSLGGFELISKLAQGGMGTVFKARQTSLDRIVALKVLPPSIAQTNPLFVERFIREARTSAKLNHPNIVQGIEVGKDAATGLYYFAMEFIDGPTAKELLKKEQRLTEQRALEITLGVAQALTSAQRAGIVHRDIKPDNILLTSKGEVKLADLGIARGNFDASLDSQDPATQPNAGGSTRVELTQAGATLGTPSYMSPEQVRGEIDRLDVRTDLYALGGTLYHLVTGHPPYQGKTTAEIMTMHRTAAVPDAREANPQVSEATAKLIWRLMQKDPKDRFQNAEEVIRAVNSILRGEPQEAPSVSAPLRPIQPESRLNRIKPIAAAVLFVVSVIVGVMIIRGKSQSAQEPDGPVAEHVDLTKALGGSKVAANKPQDIAEIPAPPPLTVPDKGDTKPDKVDTKKEPPPLPSGPGPAQPPVAVAQVTPPPVVPEQPKVTPVGEKLPAANPEPEKKEPDKKDPEKNEPAKEQPPATAQETLEQRVLECLKGPLEKLDVPAARKALNAFAEKEKLDDLQRTSAQMALNNIIEPRARALCTDIQAAAAEGHVDEAFERLNAIKFSEGADVDASEIIAKALINDAREKLTVRKTLHSMTEDIRQGKALDFVLLGVCAALEGNNEDQAAKWIDESIAKSDLASVADKLKREKELLSWWRDIRQAVEAGAGTLASGRSISLTGTDGHTDLIGKGPNELRFIKVKDGVIHLEPRAAKAVFPVKIDSLSRQTRFDLSMLSCANDKKQAAALKLKWAYADLSSMTGTSAKNSQVLDNAEKLCAEAVAEGAAPDCVAPVQTWIVRTRTRFLAAKSGTHRSALTPYLPYVSVISAGSNAGSRCKIAVNGMVFLEGGPENRGLSVVAINGEDVALKETFDTSTNPNMSQRFANAIAKLPKDTLVIVSVCDEASKNFNDVAFHALKSLGAKIAMAGKQLHTSYYCIGMTGLEEGAAVEEMSPMFLEYPKSSGKP